MPNNKVSAFQAIAISFGAIIGWGAYVMPGDLFLVKGNFLTSSLAILLGTLAIFTIAKSYINLLAITPKNKSGGLYWVYEYLGKEHAFIYGWGVLLGYISIIALNISALPLLVRYLLPENAKIYHLYSIYNWDIYLSDILFCISVLVFFCVMNYKGVKVGARIQAYFALFMILSLVILLFGSLINSNNHLSNFDFSFEYSDVGNFVWLVIITVMPWAYVGFETTPQISQDIQNSEKKTKSIITISILSGLFFYLLVNFITVLNFDFNYADIANSAWATGAGILAAMGKSGLLILGIAMALSILSGVNGFILSSLKLVESMSSVSLTPNFMLSEYGGFSRHKEILFIFGLCVLSPWFGRNILVDVVGLASVGISVSFLYVVIVDIKSQRLKFEKVSLTSYLALLVSACFILLLLVPASPAALSTYSLIFLGCFILAGLLIFSYFNRSSKA